MTIKWMQRIAPLVWMAICSVPTARAQVVNLLENDSVRVFSATFKVGFSSPLHTHALPHATYVASGGTLRIRHPDGHADTLRMKTGTAYWGKVETHIADNIGTTEVVLVTTDLKPLAPRKPPSSSGAGPSRPPHNER